jgi:hypothetical protein
MGGMATDVIVDIEGEQVLVCAPEGVLLSSESDATDLVGTALYLGAECVAIPVERLDNAFFDLRTGLAGAVAQKFVNYRLRLAIVGDVSTFVSQSDALRDFVVETNRGRQLWFLATLDDLTARLKPART